MRAAASRVAALDERTATRLLRARDRVEVAGERYDDERQKYLDVLTEIEATTTCQAIADVLGVSRQRVQQIVRGGILPTAGRAGRP